MSIVALGTYLPPWGNDSARVAGPDEDALTLAVQAGRAALAGVDAAVEQVVFVTRDLPLLEGGNGAALVAGIGLKPNTPVIEQVGGAPAALAAVVAAAPRTLIVAADTATGAGSGAAAALAGDADGLRLTPIAHVERSLPIRARGRDGSAHDYDDPRLARERGMRAALDEASITRKAIAAVGLGARDAAALCEGDAPRAPTTGASAPLFALAALAETRAAGLVLAFEQATMRAVELEPGAATVQRDEPAPLPPPSTRAVADADIKISLPAYERAFDVKLRLAAGRCPHCGTLALPPRYRCLGCGAEGDSERVELPRNASVYTTTTVHTPVPGIATPYTLVIAELGDTGVRLLAPLTATAPGGVAIGDVGTMVLRRIAQRAGIPDYGYAFAPYATVGAR